MGAGLDGRPHPAGARTRHEIDDVGIRRVGDLDARPRRRRELERLGDRRALDDGRPPAQVRPRARHAAPAQRELPGGEQLGVLGVDRADQPGLGDRAHGREVVGGVGRHEPDELALAPSRPRRAERLEADGPRSPAIDWRLSPAAPPYRPKSTCAFGPTIDARCRRTVAECTDGVEIGISRIVVMPPAAAAAVAVPKSSRSATEGSRACVWVSIAPGRTWRSVASTTRVAPGTASPAGTMATIRPASTATSPRAGPSAVTIVPPRNSSSTSTRAGQAGEATGRGAGVASDSSEDGRSRRRSSQSRSASVPSSGGPPGARTVGWAIAPRRA